MGLKMPELLEMRKRGWMMGVGEEGRGSEVHSSVNMGDAGFV